LTKVNSVTVTVKYFYVTLYGLWLFWFVAVFDVGLIPLIFNGLFNKA